jgi:hypothetical protein
VAATTVSPGLPGEGGGDDQPGSGAHDRGSAAVGPIPGGTRPSRWIAEGEAGPPSLARNPRSPEAALGYHEPEVDLRLIAPLPKSKSRSRNRPWERRGKPPSFSRKSRSPRSVIGPCGPSLPEIEIAQPQPSWAS